MEDYIFKDTRAEDVFQGGQIFDDVIFNVVDRNDRGSKDNNLFDKKHR